MSKSKKDAIHDDRSAERAYSELIDLEPAISSVRYLSLGLQLAISGVDRLMLAEKDVQSTLDHLSHLLTSATAELIEEWNGATGRCFTEAGIADRPL